MKNRVFSVLVLTAAILLLAGVSLLFVGGPVSAAPPAVPTPATASVSNDTINPPVNFWTPGTVITQDGGSTAFILAEAELLDIQYTLDQGTSVNTTTFTLQFSNDGSNWTNGLAVVSASAADVTNLLQFNNFGYRTRIFADVETSNPLTITTFSAVARR